MYLCGDFLSTMQIGIYGGSFNPVHFGHVGLAKWVAEHTDLDEVWMMVSPNNPLKDSRELADEQVRLAGVRKAIEGIPHVVASDFEFHLPRPSYTANTLRALVAAYPQHTFSLIIGEDNLRILPRWREWEYIVANYRIFVYPRRDPRHIPDKSGQAGVKAADPDKSGQVEQVSKEDSSIPDYGSRHGGINRDKQVAGEDACAPGQVSVPNAQIIVLEGAPYFDISSTEIRAKDSINDR